MNMAVFPGGSELMGNTSHDADLHMLNMSMSDFHPNMSHPFQVSERDFLPKPLSQEIVDTFIALYCLIIVLACLGNLLVIVVVVRSPAQRTVTDIFIMSLAVSDLLIATLNMPFQLNYLVNNEWTLGEQMCKFTHYIQAVTIATSILTLTTIAMDRYFTICHPLKSRQIHTTRKACKVLIIIWVISLAIVSPQIIIQRLDFRLVMVVMENDVRVPSRIAFICVEDFPNITTDGKIYTLFYYVVLYLLPVIIMTVAYGTIARRLWVRQPIGNVVDTPRAHIRQLTQKKRVVRMLMAIVICFVLCWFPFFTVQLYFEFHHYAPSYRIPMGILQLIGYSNCCINPIIYTFLNKSFKTQLHQAFACGNKQFQLHEPISSTTSVKLDSSV